MPPIEVIIFMESDGSAPFWTWLKDLPPKVQIKCKVRIDRLRQLGHELRRPDADYLRDGIYELRVRWGNVHYRILYFFYGKSAVVSHGLTKEDVVPNAEINRALNWKLKFEKDPQAHSCGEPDHG